MSSSSNQMKIVPYNRAQASKVRAYLTNKDWEPYRQEIMSLRQKKVPLPEIQQFMNEKFGLDASASQYKAIFAKWKSKVYLTKVERQYIVQETKRKLSNDIPRFLSTNDWEFLDEERVLRICKREGGRSRPNVDPNAVRLIAVSPAAAFTNTTGERADVANCHSTTDCPARNKISPPTSVPCATMMVTSSKHIYPPKSTNFLVFLKDDIGVENIPKLLDDMLSFLGISSDYHYDGTSNSFTPPLLAPGRRDRRLRTTGCQNGTSNIPIPSGAKSATALLQDGTTSVELKTTTSCVSVSRGLSEQEANKRAGTTLLDTERELRQLRSRLFTWFILCIETFRRTYYKRSTISEGGLSLLMNALRWLTDRKWISPDEEYDLVSSDWTYPRETLYDFEKATDESRFGPENSTLAALARLTRRLAWELPNFQLLVLLFHQHTHTEIGRGADNTTRSKLVTLALRLLEEAESQILGCLELDGEARKEYDHLKLHLQSDFEYEKRRSDYAMFELPGLPSKPGGDGRAWGSSETWNCVTLEVKLKNYLHCLSKRNYHAARPDSLLHRTRCDRIIDFTSTVLLMFKFGIKCHLAIAAATKTDATIEAISHLKRLKSFGEQLRSTPQERRQGRVLSCVQMRELDRALIISSLNAGKPEEAESVMMAVLRDQNYYANKSEWHRPPSYAQSIASWYASEWKKDPIDHSAPAPKAFVSALKYYHCALEKWGQTHSRRNIRSIMVVREIRDLLSRRGLVRYSRPLSDYIVKAFEKRYGPMHPLVFRSMLEAADESLACQLEIFET